MNEQEIQNMIDKLDEQLYNKTEEEKLQFFMQFGFEKE